MNADIAEAPGTIELNQTPTNDIPPGGGGRGTVFYRGSVYRFGIGGLGVDGSAVAVIQTTGHVYQLSHISMFSGTYRQVPAGTDLPSSAGTGVWLRNERGVLLHLNAPPQGRMPDIDGDAVRVVMD
jgi:hypothetical protein